MSILLLRPRAEKRRYNGEGKVNDEVREKGFELDYIHYTVSSKRPIYPTLLIQK